MVDPLARILNAAASAKIYEGVGNPWIYGGTKILQYANDTLIFIKIEKQYLAVLKTILYCFELISSLSINFQKSSISFIGKRQEEISRLVCAKWLNCQEMKTPFRRLGLTPNESKPIESDWISMIQRIKNQLAS